MSDKILEIYLKKILSWYFIRRRIYYLVKTINEVMSLAFEKVILDLQEKVLSLEEIVNHLNQRVSELEQQVNEENVELKKDSTHKSKINGTAKKVDIISSIQDILSSRLPNEVIRKASREEGSGVIIANGERQLKICLRGSGYYGKDDVSKRMKYTGFSSLTKDTIEDRNGQMKYDFFIFAVSRSDDPNKPKFDFFIFNQEQFKKLLSQKKPSGKSSMYYFYFGETTSGHYIDDRERTKNLLVDDEYNNWNGVVEYFEN